MNPKNSSLFSALALMSVFAGASFTASCDETLPSDTTTTTTTGAAGAAGAGAQGGAAGAGGKGGAAGAGAQGGAAGSGGAGGAPDCTMNPMTHVEIINACTDAEKIDKKPVLPLLKPDGSLPPLP